MIKFILLIAIALAQCCSVPQQTGAVASSGGGTNAIYVQTCTGSSASTVASYTVTCGSAATVGHYFLMENKINNTGTTFTVTGETLSAVFAGYPVNAYTTNEIYVMADASITTSRTTYTVNCGGTNCSFPDSTWDEYNPNGHTMTLDQNSAMPVAGAASTTVTSSSITPTLNNEMILCPATVNNVSTNLTWTAPFAGGVNSGGGQEIGHFGQGTKAAITCTASWTGSQDATIGILSLE